MQFLRTVEAGSPDPVAMTIPGLSSSFICLSSWISCEDLRREGREGGEGERWRRRGELRRGKSYLLPDAYNQAFIMGTNPSTERLHTALVLGNSWCCSYCACLGSLQTVDDATLANIRQTWSEIFNMHDILEENCGLAICQNISTSLFLNNGTNLYKRRSHISAL